MVCKTSLWQIWWERQPAHFLDELNTVGTVSRQGGHHSKISFLLSSFEEIIFRALGSGLFVWKIAFLVCFVDPYILLSLWFKKRSPCLFCRPLVVIRIGQEKGHPWHLLIWISAVLVTWKQPQFLKKRKLVIQKIVLIFILPHLENPCLLQSCRAGLREHKYSCCVSKGSDAAELELKFDPFIQNEAKV